jgi:hypothetical protein
MTCEPAHMDRLSSVQGQLTLRLVSIYQQPAQASGNQLPT